jgi:DNA (cytosine-5)-methyltransferase 1
MTYGSLFSGIGGMDLGLDRAGLECRWQVEISPFGRRVLAKHWPDVPKHDDVKTFPPNEGDWSVDLITGGFPCQDVSLAGKRAGIDGGRSGLWAEYKRIILAIRPRYVLVENTPGLLSSGFGRVLGDLASLGFDAEWDCFPASAFGAYHERDRVFILAYRPRVDGHSRRLLETSREGRASLQSRRLSCMAVATRAERSNQRLEREPRLARLVDGVPDRTHRLERLGNAIFPDVTEWIGHRLMESQA